MFAGYKPEDSGLDIGDSAITETYGIGGFAMATAPAIVALVGGTVEEAIDFSRQMREITLGENPNVTIPLLSFMGIPTAIDITRVAGSGILPVINTAIAHKDAGIGMIGAGIVHPPFSCFEKALLTFRDRYFYKASIHENMKLEWKRGDWAAYFGLMTNNLTNLLTMMGLLILSSASRRRLFMDASRRLRAGGAGGERLLRVVWPADGARHRTNGRHRAAVWPERAVDFTVTFLVLMPVYQQTGDADFAIQIGLVWCFVEAMILAGGSFRGDHPQDDPAYRAALVSVGPGPAVAGDEPDAAGV